MKNLSVTGLGLALSGMSAAPRRTEFFLASVLLEPNRWKAGKQPSMLVSDWSEQAANAGFAGWELWENHYHLADEAERRRIATGPLPVRVFNTYVAFDDARAASLQETVRAARTLGVTGIKFNLGRDPSTWPAERTCVSEVARQLAPSTRLLCECHPGTSLEVPESVPEFVGEQADWPFEVIVHPFLLGPEKIIHAGKLFGRHLTHLHVQMRSLKHEATVLALSDEPTRAKECLAALAQINFQGSFTCEFAAPTGQPGETPATLFAAAVRDLEFLKANWK